MMSNKKILGATTALVFAAMVGYIAGHRSTVTAKSTESIASRDATATSEFNTKEILERYKECAKVRYARVEKFSQQKYDKMLDRDRKPRMRLPATLVEFRQESQEKMNKILALSQEDFEQRLAKMGSCGGKKDAAAKAPKGKTNKEGKAEGANTVTSDNGSVLVQMPVRYSASSEEDEDDDVLVSFKPL